MRKMTLALTTLALAAVGFAVPTTAQASAGCNAAWPGRDGNVRAWRDWDCAGGLLGVSAGNDASWADGSGGFQGVANSASSVMNSGYVGGKDVVAFYYYANYGGGYGCLKPGELYVDDLTRDHFTDGHPMNDNIMSHQWVTESACAAGSFIS
ncbi:hypothetical protein ACGF5O_28575 [Streptomyces sp. NPDC048291]|uniref:hypothetical protein n=1 Tax=unclassified Streptomyces TaxID=2593676 RepID=UPI00371F2805